MLALVKDLNPETNRYHSVYMGTDKEDAIFNGFFETEVELGIDENYYLPGRGPKMQLDAVKIERREYINKIRDTKEQSGFKVGEDIYDSDSISQARMLAAVQAAGILIASGQIPAELYQISWTLADNRVKTLTYAEINNVFIQGVVYVNEVHGIATACKELIDAAETVEEVNAITWPDIELSGDPNYVPQEPTEEPDILM